MGTLIYRYGTQVRSDGDDPFEYGLNIQSRFGLFLFIFYTFTENNDNSFRIELHKGIKSSKSNTNFGCVLLTPTISIAT